MKKGREDNASAAFPKVVEQYPGYEEVVGLARVRFTSPGSGTNGETLAMSTRQVWAPAAGSIFAGTPSPDGRFL